MKENKNEIFMYCIYNILALSLARCCAACVSSHMAARLQNPKINFPLTNTTGLKELSYTHTLIFIDLAGRIDIQISLKRLSLWASASKGQGPVK